MNKHRTVTLKNDVRTLTRSSNDSKTLSNAHIRWIRKGNKIEISEPLEMDYDHRTKTVVQLIGSIPDRYIIISELDIVDTTLEQYSIVA